MVVGTCKPPGPGQAGACAVQGMVRVPVGSILGWQSLKALVTSPGSSAVQCTGVLQQRMLTK